MEVGAVLGLDSVRLQLRRMLAFDGRDKLRPHRECGDDIRA